MSKKNYLANRLEKFEEKLNQNKQINWSTKNYEFMQNEVYLEQGLSVQLQSGDTPL